MSNIDKQAGEGDVSPKTYYIHPMAFGGTQNPGYGHVPVVHADDFEKQRAKPEAAEKRIAELEAREVKLPAEKFCPAEYAGSQLWEETEIWNKAVQSCEDAIRTEGIKVTAAGKGE